MEARVVGSRTWLHLGPARPLGWGRGARAQGRKSRLVVVPACSLRHSSRPQPPSKIRTYSCTRDSLQIGKLEHGKVRGAAGWPAGLRAPPGEFLCPASPFGTQRTIRFESLPQERMLFQLWTGKGKGHFGFYLPPQRLCSSSLTRHLKRKLRKSHRMRAENLICSSFYSIDR